MLIKDMPVMAKPREKALKYGVSALSTDELIAILIRSGYRNHSAKDVAIEIVKELDLIRDIQDLSLERISSLKGVGVAKALTLLASIELGRRLNHWPEVEPKVFNCAAQVFHLFRPKVVFNQQEEFYVILLNQKKKLIAFKSIFKGDVASVNVHPREIFKFALVNAASSIILMHNHPSGDPFPSKQDLLITHNLIKIGNLIQIPVIDHVIIGRDKYYSFFEENQLNE